MADLTFRPENEKHETDRKVRLGRIAYRAWRRGFREADMVLGPFADQIAPDLSDEELAIFEDLLDVEDQYLYGWIIERDQTPPEHQGPVMDKIRAFMREHVSAEVAKGIG